MAVACSLMVAAVAVWTLNRAPGEGRMWRTYTLNGTLVNLAVTWIAAAAAYVALPRTPPRRRILRALGASIALGLGLALVEAPAVVLGFDYGKLLSPGSADWLGASKTVNRPDPELVHLHWGNSSYRGDVTGNLVWRGIPNPTRYTVDVRYDTTGFRNDRDLARAEVAVIGDSFIEAAILPRQQGVAALLEEQLGTSVANLGQAAYGLQQGLHVLRRFALPLEPRLVVWFLFGGNDFRDVEAYETAIANRDRKPEPEPLGARTFTRNALLLVSSLTTPERTQPGAAALDASGWFTRSDGSRERFYFGAGCPPCTPYQWEVATGTLGEAVRLSAEAKATFVLVYIPRKYRVYRDHMEFEPGTSAAAWPVSDLPARLAAWCRAQEVPYLDLSPRLEEVVARGEHPYLVDDVHWNAAGHRLAAEAVLEMLAAIGWKAERR